MATVIFLPCVTFNSFAARSYLLAICGTLLAPRVRLGGGIPQDEHELRVVGIRVWRCRIHVIIVENIAALRPAARACRLGHQLVKRLGVVAGTGDVPMGRGGGRHGDVIGRWSGTMMRRVAVGDDVLDLRNDAAGKIGPLKFDWPKELIKRTNWRGQYFGSRQKPDVGIV